MQIFILIRNNLETINFLANNYLKKNNNLNENKLRKLSYHFCQLTDSAIAENWWDGGFLLEKYILDN